MKFLPCINLEIANKKDLSFSSIKILAVIKMGLENPLTFKKTIENEFYFWLHYEKLLEITKLNFSRSTLNRKLSELEQKGLVNRFLDKTSGNKAFVGLTNEGYQIFEINSEIKINAEIKKESKKRKDTINKIYFKKEKVNEIFLEFLELRKKLKAQNTERAIKMLISKLNEYDDDIKIEMINNSIVNSWKGIFEIRSKSFNKQKDLKKDYKAGLKWAESND